MKEAISLMGRSKSVFVMTSNTMYQLLSEPSRQDEFEDLVMNFILGQEDFMQLSLKVVEKLREEIRIERNRTKKLKKITRYPDTEDLKPLNDHKFLETLTKEVPSHTLKIVSPKSVYVKHLRTIFLSLPLVRESIPQVLPSFEKNTPLMTYSDEVEEIIGISIEVEPLDETPLEDLGLNTCNHDIPLNHEEISNFDEPEPQPQPLPSCLTIDGNPPLYLINKGRVRLVTQTKTPARSMGIRHAKAYNLRGTSSMKQGKGLAKSKPTFSLSAKAFLPRLSETWKPSNCRKNSSIPSKLDHAHICTTIGAILRTTRKSERWNQDLSPTGKLLQPFGQDLLWSIGNEKELWDLRKHRTGKEAGEEGTPKMHPSSVLRTDDEGVFPNYVVYHELISTSHPYMRNVYEVEMEWVTPILKKLEKLNVKIIRIG
ncbi:ribonuclease H-like domain-containing protein [Tanacetum coccineum]